MRKCCNIKKKCEKENKNYFAVNQTRSKDSRCHHCFILRSFFSTKSSVIRILWECTSSFSHRPSFYEAAVNPFFRSPFAANERAHSRIYMCTLRYRKITRILAIMKTSRRRTATIITGSQPYNLLRA